METLIGVLQNLIEHGATVVVIEHDLDMIANADYVIDMGPGGGETDVYKRQSRSISIEASPTTGA